MLNNHTIQHHTELLGQLAVSSLDIMRLFVEFAEEVFLDRHVDMPYNDLVLRNSKQNPDKQKGRSP